MHNIYKVFFERAQEAMLVFNEQGHIKSANPKAEKLFGYNRAELMDKHIASLVAPENRNTFLSAYQSLLAGQNSVNGSAMLNFWGQTKQGKRIALSTEMENHIHTQEGTLIMAVITDESKMVENKIKLTESEKRFSEIFYASPSANVISQISNGCIIEMNGNFNSLTGYSREELIGYTCDDFSLFTSTHERLYLLAKLNKGTEIKNHELSISTKSGERREVILCVSIISFGGKDYALSCMIDITEKKRAELELKQSEERFSIAFTASPAALAVISMDGSYIDANKSFLDIFGYTKGELVGKTFMELNMYNDTGELTRLVSHLSEQGKISNFEITTLTKTGERVIGILSMETIRMQSNEYILATILDITEKKKSESALRELNREIERRTEEKLKQSEEVFFKIFESSPVPISLIDSTTFTITHANPACERLFGHAKDYIIGKTWAQLNLAGNTLQNKLMQQITLGEPQVNNLEIRMHTGDGTVKDVLVSAEMIQRDEKQCLLVTSVDFSERKKTEEKMKEALDKERESNEMKSRFVSMASHQFRTPLAAILSSIDIIDLHLQNNDILKCKRHIQRIKSSVSNLTGILNDFLSLDKLESGKVVPKKKPLDLKALARAAVEEAGLSFKMGQQVIYMHEGNSSLVQDENILHNILLNLLSNAGKYSAEHEKIELRTKITDGLVTISVKDNGIGIPEKEQARICGRFYRAENAEMIEGTGLGLNIVKRYAGLLKGELTFVSKENHGSTFTVRFPL